MPRPPGVKSKVSRTPDVAETPSKRRRISRTNIMGDMGQEPDVDLQAIRNKQADTINKLKDVEKQIFDLETKYLETICHPLGNAVKGYRGFLKASEMREVRASTLSADDRWFSSSSATGDAHLAPTHS